MSPKKPTSNPHDVTTTGRTKDPSTKTPEAAPPAAEPTLRPVNHDAHGVAGQTEETAASKLEDEAKAGRENRY